MAYYFIMIAHFLVLHFMVYRAFYSGQDLSTIRVLSSDSILRNFSYASYFLIFLCLVMNTVLSYKDPGFDSVVKKNLSENLIGSQARNSKGQLIGKDENFLNLLK